MSVQCVHFQNFTWQGPVARGKKDQPVLILHAGRKCPRKQEGVPRNGGLGAMTVSARCAKALTGSGPQRVFGSFLTAQKGTRPAGRNPASHNPLSLRSKITEPT